MQVNKPTDNSKAEKQEKNKEDNKDPEHDRANLTNNYYVKSNPVASSAIVPVQVRAKGNSKVVRPLVKLLLL